MEFTGERLILGPESGWFWNQLALEHVARYSFARQFAAGKDVLDAACGTGYGTSMLGESARRVTGVDISPETVNFAQANWKRNNVQFAVGDVTDLPIEAASIDLIVSFETIEHVPSPDAFAAEVERVLRPGGLFVVSTPNRDVYNWADFSSDHRNHFHLAEMTPDEFTTVLAARFEVRQVLGQRRLSEYRDQATDHGPARRQPRAAWQTVLRGLVKSVTGPVLNLPWIARRTLPLVRSVAPQPLTDEPWKYIIAVCAKR